MIEALLWAAGGTGFTFMMTSLGAATVLFVGAKVKMGLQRGFFGFAAGVMMAASVWSLLLPAIERAEGGPVPPALIAGTGLAAGVLFLMGLDRLIPHLHPDTGAPEGLSARWKRTTLLFLAVTLHNIPEGMAVGLAFAMAAQEGDFSGAVALAMGIGIQNFPEGAAGHCSYDRRIDFFGYQIKIRIVRIKCSSCNATNAILIEDMVPFYRLSHETIIKVIESDSCDLASHKKFLLSNFVDIDIHSYDDVCQYSCKIKNRSINIIFCLFST